MLQTTVLIGRLTMLPVRQTGRRRRRPGVGDDEGHCRPVSGDITSVVFPDCPEEAVLCTHGLLSGDLEATYDFIMLMIGPHPDDDNALIYSGVSVIETGNGHQLFGDDSGVMYPQPDGTRSRATGTGILNNRLCGPSECGRRRDIGEAEGAVR